MSETQILDPLPEESQEPETVSGNASDQDLTFEDGGASETVSGSDASAEPAAPDDESTTVPVIVPDTESGTGTEETETVQLVEVTVDSTEIVTALETGFTAVCIFLGLILGVLLMKCFYVGRT